MTSDASIDLAKIKRNVEKMASQGAPAEHINGYIESQGATVDQIRSLGDWGQTSATDLTPEPPPSMPERIVDQGIRPEAPEQESLGLVKSATIGAGQAGRTVGAGISGMLDVPLAVPKGLAAGADWLLEKGGMGDTGVSRALEKVYQTPPMRDTTVRAIDEATGGELQPKGFWNKALMFGGEVAAGGGTAAKTVAAEKAAQRAPDVMTAVREVLEPGAGFMAAEQKVADTARAIKDIPADWAKSKEAKAWREFANEYVTPEAIRVERNQAYDFAEEQGGNITTAGTSAFVRKAQEFAGTAIEKVFKDKSFTEVLEKIGELEGKELTFKEASTIDKFLTQQAKKHVNPNGTINEVGREIEILQDAFRETILSGDPRYVSGTTKGFDAYKEGARLFRKELNMRDINQIIERGIVGQKIEADAIKNGFRALYNNKKKLNSFDPEVQKLIKEAATSTATGDFLLQIGSRLNAIAAFYASGPLAAAATYLASGGARRGAAAIQAGKAKDVAAGVAKDYRFKEPVERAVSRPQEPLALPPPDKARTMREQGFVGQGSGAGEMIASPGGDVMQAGKQEILELAKKRQDFTASGMREAYKNNVRKRLGEKFKQAEADQKAKYEAEIDAAWKEHKKTLDQIIRMQQAKRQELRRVTGEPQDPSTVMEEAFRRIGQ
jgi:hypothetical protein